MRGISSSTRKKQKVVYATRWLLVTFMDDYLRPTFRLRKLNIQGTLTQISFSDLWHIFDVGDDVIQKHPNEDSITVYRVVKVTGGREPLIPKIKDVNSVPLDGFMIDTYTLAYNGIHLGPQLHTFTIRKFQGSIPIDDLPVFPLRLSSQSATVRPRASHQAKKFLELIELPYCHKTYVGRTLDDPPEEVNAQVIVDMSLAINRNPGWQPELKIEEAKLTPSDLRETTLEAYCKHNYYEGCCGSDVILPDYVVDRDNASEYFRANTSHLRPYPITDLRKTDHILLPHAVYGFILRSRHWVTLDTRYLSMVEYRDSFDQLVLKKQHTEAVRALVKNHKRGSFEGPAVQAATSILGGSVELVRGKGKGLIILLHGAPGVGKTSTAECVADMTERPLFPVTCGDIGETAMDVQKNLDSSFQLAHKWGYVLLLDEAE
jgi:hypothetical protein